MRKILLLIVVFLTCLSVKAQQITFTSSSVYSNDASVLITAQGEDNNLAVDMQTLPSVTGVTPSVFPTNGTAYLTDIKRISNYSASQHTKSSFTAKVYSSVNFEVTASWEIKVTFVNINGVSSSNGTVKYKVTVRPGSSPDPVVYNEEQSSSFYKNNCEVGNVGSSVKYTVPARKYTAASLTEANNKAKNDINANGQNYANANGTCTAGYYNDEQKGLFTPSCGADYEYVGVKVTYLVPKNKYIGTTPEEANNKAINDVNTNGQNWANANYQKETAGNCVLYYYNSETSKSYFKNDCGTGYSPSLVTYTIPARKYKATQPFPSRGNGQLETEYPSSLLTADFNANGQNFANATGTCTIPQAVYAQIKNENGSVMERGVDGTEKPKGIIVTFFSDAAGTTPLYVNGKTINYIIKADGLNVSGTGTAVTTGTDGVIYTIPVGSPAAFKVSLAPSSQYQIIPSVAGGGRPPR